MYAFLHPTCTVHIHYNVLPFEIKGIPQAYRILRHGYAFVKLFHQSL